LSTEAKHICICNKANLPLGVGFTVGTFPAFFSYNLVTSCCGSADLQQTEELMLWTPL